MAAPVNTPDLAERREYGSVSVTWYATIAGREYWRRVEIEVVTDNDYGADADGRRGVAARFIEIGLCESSAPAMGTPERDIFDDAAPSPDALADDWCENYEVGC
jgi:hypothetical protein